MALENFSPFTAYHAANSDFVTFDPRKSSDGMTHVGTATQATMRGGSSSVLLKVSVYATALIRMNDKSGIWRKPTAKQREIADGIVYLNRFEGIKASATSHDFTVSDNALKASVGVLHDSYGIFDPDNLRIIERIEWNSERHKQILAYEAHNRLNCIDTPDTLPLIPTQDAIEEAQAFCLMKLREEAGDEAIKDLSGSSRVTSLFAQKLFGGQIEGNDSHQFLRLTDGDICDLNCEAADVLKMTSPYDVNPDFRQSVENGGQISRWIHEFVRDSEVSKEARRSLVSKKTKISAPFLG